MADRIEADNYPTPDALAAAICEKLAAYIPPPDRILEPSAGEGAFVRAARATWARSAIYALDIREECRAPCCDGGAVFFARQDATSAAVSTSGVPLFRGGVSLVVGNPPYSGAEKHVAAARSWLARGGHLAFLLRLSFLGSAGRAERLWSKPGLRYLAPINPRPSFINGTSDNSEYAVFVWQEGYAGNAEILPPLIWRKPAASSLSTTSQQSEIPLSSVIPRGGEGT